MKKIFISIIAILSIFGASSCSDMLETESSRQVFDPELDQKTDSLFYALGVMQAMQQLADQYVFQGEMRGDLVKTTSYTDNNLRQLADFSATTTNKYDSAYVYYRVINNCNYYIAHRDTTLLTGSTNVVIGEYVAMKAFRAWAYLQLVRNYGKVPFFTEPLTSISQINNSQFPELDINGIVDALGPDLAQYSGTPVPNPNEGEPYDIGSTNLGQSKEIILKNCYIPVDVILGELNLEANRYAEAARYYTNYLITTKTTSTSIAASMYTSNHGDITMPSDFGGTITGATLWDVIFEGSITDIITYIPMAVNRLRGTTTSVPTAFGYNYYANSRNEAYLDEIQIQPSAVYTNLSDSTDYYYYQNRTGGQPQQYVGVTKVGDMRINSVLRDGTGVDSAKVWMLKYNYSGNIILYRKSTIYLHLAEALNRLGHPDAAFAILKEGINEHIVEPTTTYITPETRTLFTTTYPFLSDANKSVFTSDVSAGIHQHGAGVTSDGNYPGRSPYQLDTIVGTKMAEIASKFGVTVGATKADSINAMEDLLCDEYALELSFEGRRFYDLCRLARHKNASSPAGYPANFGGLWLQKKLAFKNPSKDLSVEQNWYLPFKK